MSHRFFTSLVALWLCCPPLAATAQQPALPSEFVFDGIRVVEDPDGYVNVRSRPTTQSEVVRRVNAGALVEILSEADGWVEISKSNATGERLGYIHGSRLVSPKTWPQHPCKAESPAETATVRHGAWSVTLTEAPFDGSKHKLTRPDAEGPVLLDGKPYWGKDGGMPDRSLVLKITFEGRPIEVPAEAVDNFFQPNPETLLLIERPDGGILILSENSDGGGGYCAMWSFSKTGKYLGRIAHYPY